MTLDDGKLEDDASQHDRDVERLLDNALAQYAMTEPRPGLEGRVLARLASAREKSRHALPWWGLFALGTAAALALALFFLGQLNPRLIPDAPVARLARPPQTGESNTSKVAAQKRGGPTKQATERPLSAGKGKPAALARPDTPPKLEQFPAPAPLSDQERMLAAYVRDFPRTAALMAGAQTEARKENEREMAAPWPRNSPEGLGQPE